MYITEDERRIMKKTYEENIRKNTENEWVCGGVGMYTMGMWWWVGWEPLGGRVLNVICAVYCGVGYSSVLVWQLNSIYVFMYVFMYVISYVFIHVCMYGCTYLFIYWFNYLFRDSVSCLFIYLFIYVFI